MASYNTQFWFKTWNVTSDPFSGAIKTHLERVSSCVTCESRVYFIEAYLRVWFCKIYCIYKHVSYMILHECLWSDSKLTNFYCTSSQVISCIIHWFFFFFVKYLYELNQFLCNFCLKLMHLFLYIFLCSNFGIFLWKLKPSPESKNFALNNYLSMSPMRLEFFMGMFR